MNRRSIEAQYHEDAAVEFSSLPLATVQTVRVRHRDVGMLPPMSLEDEVNVED